MAARMAITTSSSMGVKATSERFGIIIEILAGGCKNLFAIYHTYHGPHPVDNKKNAR
jgi:hypothetical protein